MPVCSACLNDLPKEAYSGAQLKKVSGLRRCKGCVRTEAVSISTAYVPTQRVTFDTERCDIHSILRDLATRILSPHRVEGVPAHLRDPITLTAYLVRVLVEEGASVTWLLKPLIKGLWEGHSAINEPVAVTFMAPSDYVTLLAWACQFRFMQRAMGWVGSEDMISLILATPGIQVSKTMENKTNAAFFVVKYGSPGALDLLINAGINMQQRDFQNRTMLYNALEYPNPEMLRRVLEHVPATEMYETVDSSTGQQFYLSCADRIMALYGCTITGTEQGRRINGLLSWINLGTPPLIQDVAEALIMVRQRGAKFTVDGSSAPWECLGAIHRGDAVMNVSEDFVRLGQSVLGFWLPPATKEHVLRFDGEKPAALEERLSANAEECSICLSPFHKRTTLFCGHTFCRGCILDYGKSSGKSCPMCRQPLCKDLLPRGADRAPSAPSMNQVGNLDGDFLEVIAEYHRTLMSLSDSQVVQEARIQGFYSRSTSIPTLRNKLVKDVKENFLIATNGFHMQQVGAADTGNDSVEITVELSSTFNFGDGTTSVVVAPSKGPAMVEIMVKGTPVVSHLSNNSRYTVVSSAFVDNFNLDRLDKLETKEFRCGLTAKRLENMRLTCLKSLEFSIGGVNVMLRNAVEADPDLEGIGIQLGQDFFLSARFCAVDVFVGMETEGSPNSGGYRCNGVASWFTPNLEQESLRYYSHSGTACNVDLLHFNPNKEGRLSAICLKWDASFTQCNWCSRVFPEGMRACSVCLEAGDLDQYYCDEECQRAAYELHEEKHTAHRT